MEGYQRWCHDDGETLRCITKRGSSELTFHRRDSHARRAMQDDDRFCVVNMSFHHRQEEDGGRRVYEAAADGDLETLQALLSAAAPSHYRSSVRETLQRARASCCLLAHSPDGDDNDDKPSRLSAPQDRGQTPLHAAAANNFDDCVRVLLAASADIHSRNRVRCLLPLTASTTPLVREDMRRARPVRTAMRPD